MATYYKDNVKRLKAEHYQIFVNEIWPIALDCDFKTEDKGVYLIFDRSILKQAPEIEAVEYIGKSIHIGTRLYRHKTNRVFDPFIHVAKYFPESTIKIGSLIWFEGYLINLLRPKKNVIIHEDKFFYKRRFVLPSEVQL